MADEDNTTAQTTPAAPSTDSPAAASPQEPPPVQSDPPPPTDRTELIQRARAFLTSPQVRHEDAAAKRRFLAEKCLTDAEIEGLLYEVPPPAPPLPPRTYPQPPPSRVPYLLLNVFRAFTWIAGSSAALVLAYFRFIYPKIAQTYQARLSLRTHRKVLLERLTHSLEELKTTQQSTFAVLPQPEPFREPAKYAECRGLEQLVTAAGDDKNVPPIALLRCAIADCSKAGLKATSAELFGALEAKLPWIAEEGAHYEEMLWQTLITTPLFQPAPPPPSTSTPSSSSTSPSNALSPPSHPTLPSPDTVWTYHPPAPSPSPPLLTSLTTLKSALPPPPASSPAAQPKYQHTLQALTDLTGYIAAQTYAHPHPHAFRLPGMGLGMGMGSAALSPEEEDVRREIRALKGLVLNRRSFMPRVGLPRPGSASGISMGMGSGMGTGDGVDGAAASSA